MEILSNFASIYCYISFVIGAVLMLVSLAIVAMSKDYDEPRNRVRFFVQKSNNVRILYLYNTKTKTYHKIWYKFLQELGLNPDDFADMEEGEIREVFLILED